MMLSKGVRQYHRSLNNGTSIALMAMSKKHIIIGAIIPVFILHLLLYNVINGSKWATYMCKEVK